MKKLFKKDSDEEHNFWMSYTDLMSGFLIIFIIASIIAMINNRQLSDKIPQGEHHSLNSLKALVDTSLYVINDGYYIKDKNDTIHVRINSFDVYRDSTYTMLDTLNNKKNMQNLIAEFREFEGINGDVKVVIDEVKGSIKLYHRLDDEELFPSTNNPHIPRRALLNFLDNNGKRIINRAMCLMNLYPNIELRIEGHTDPKGRLGQLYGGDESFVYNMELSSRRANEVYSYLYNSRKIGLNEQEKEFLRNYAISVGYSFSERIKDGTHKDEQTYSCLDNPSRRIEFRIIAK